MRANVRLVVDLILFFLFPLVFWELSREMIGDYPAMLFSALPGLIYSLYRFKERRLNFTSLFMFINLIAGFLLDLLSGSAIQLLWNNIFYSAALFLIYAGSLAAGKPLHMYFALDMMELNGHDRKLTKELFFEKKVYRLCQLITALCCLNEMIYMAMMTKWIQRYGVETYRLDLVFDKSIDIVLSGISLILFLLIRRKAEEALPVSRIAKLNGNTLYVWELSYLFFCNVGL
ncbi:VC0807 family protein [Peribacillus kribbensis]|uniref:VC0807 family protein n=1 Tax=Peribacillus kribbensis TaxID=356658 RepID=UPI0004231145|nr:VC0807 family protein [Peribacillus kribbensis]